MVDINITEQQKNMGRHALGLPNERKTSYRNHFVTGRASTDYDAWINLVDQKLAVCYPPSELTGGDLLFKLTRYGAKAMLEPGETLCPEDFPETVRD